MLFLNISSDKVVLDDGSRQESLERNGIEKSLGPVLVEWTRSYYPPLTPPGNKEGNKSNIILLNGPGGFTNLRVGTLDLNLLNTLLEKPIEIYSCTKIQLYRYLVQIGFLPSVGLLYLGQRKNIWNYDFAKSEYQQIVLSSVLDKIPAPSDKAGMTGENIFVDYVVDAEYRGELREKMVSFAVKGESLEVTWQGKSVLVSVSDLGLEAVHQVKAEYLMEAI